MDKLGIECSFVPTGALNDYKTFHCLPHAGEL